MRLRASGGLGRLAGRHRIVRHVAASSSSSPSSNARPHVREESRGADAPQGAGPTAKGEVPACSYGHGATWGAAINKTLYAQAGGIKGRVRQHVNPLKRGLLAAAEELVPPDWGAIYDDPTLPLHVDVGCGYGRFLLALALRSDDAAASASPRNLLGVDIREPIVARGNRWVTALGAESEAAAASGAPPLPDPRGVLHFTTANATLSLGSLLSSYDGPLRLVTIQFPDPHFKRRHRKRLMVQPALVDAIAARMAKDRRASPSRPRGRRGVD